MRDAYSGIAVVVQARIGSSRLPEKALKLLGGKPLLAHTLDMMRQVQAERYILACDSASEPHFAPIAEQCGFMLLSGSEEDVLGRFCTVIRKFEHSLRPIRTIVRATGDNPFLFADAAAASVKRFIALDEPDYFTYTGLPHGSGVEVMNARSLLTAEMLTSSPYDHEHVGPALYRNTDTFVCIREPAPLHWYEPELRTTVDTAEDFTRAEMIVRYFEKMHIPYPPPSEAIIAAYRYISRTVAFVPSVREGQGTGHVRRVCTLMRELAATTRCVLVIPEGEHPAFAAAVPQQFGITAIVPAIPSETCLIILDNFRTSEEEMRAFKAFAPVAALDEGGEGRAFADYIVDILPRLPLESSRYGEAVHENIADCRFIPLPENRKPSALVEKNIRDKRFFLEPEHTKILVVCGGEDAARLAVPIAEALVPLKAEISVIDPLSTDASPFRTDIEVYRTIENLRERLHEWDVVVTHYGFTAFEAAAAGCAVMLVSPTDYHYRLGCAAGFSVLPPCGSYTTEQFAALFAEGISCPAAVSVQTPQRSLPDFILMLAAARVQSCPLCGSIGLSADESLSAVQQPSEVPIPCGRAENKTVCVCGSCGMYYPSFIVAEQKEYSEQYFFDEYRAQYGKTYLEDFDSIKTQGLRRMGHVQQLYASIFEKGHKPVLFDAVHSGSKRILDIGCAYGPFLSAAKDCGWNPVGTDISSDAVQYVCGTLGIPACCSPFPVLPDSFQFTIKRTFTEKKEQVVGISLASASFSAVTMWFVIEHFQDLDSVLRRVQQLLIPGGVFAFSTPALSGVSGRWKRRRFFAESPTDHYTIWDRRTVCSQLTRYGFLVKKIVSTGHHPERFPYAANIKKGGFIWNVLMLCSRVFKLGDSMEVYAIKRGAIHE